MAAILANARASFRRFLPLACIGTSLFLIPLSSRAQNSSTPAPETPTTDSAKKPTPPAKPKHVITNEDLEPRSNANAKDGKFLPGESSLLICDTSCEQAARSELGYDSDNEAEWRVQIGRARRDLLEDTTWRGMLSQAIQQSNYYCNFLLQQTQQTAPSGNDYNSQVQRARNANYFENMDRTLKQGLQSTMNRMQEHMKEVQVLSPVRAAMMSAQTTRIFDRTCEFPAKR